MKPFFSIQDPTNREELEGGESTKMKIQRVLSS
jgi:hypothetical protein